MSAITIEVTATTRCLRSNPIGDAWTHIRNNWALITDEMESCARHNTARDKINRIDADMTHEDFEDDISDVSDADTELDPDEPFNVEGMVRELGRGVLSQVYTVLGAGLDYDFPMSDQWRDVKVDVTEAECDEVAAYTRAIRAEVVGDMMPVDASGCGWQEVDPLTYNDGFVGAQPDSILTTIPHDVVNMLRPVARKELRKMQKTVQELNRDKVRYVQIREEARNKVADNRLKRELEQAIDDEVERLPKRMCSGSWDNPICI
jgi:hypothetical protein